MADVIKRIDRNIPGVMRMQKFTESDASVGDVILIKESLGKIATNVTVTATAAMTVRFNVYHTVVPHRTTVDQTDMSSWAPGLDNPAKASQYQTDELPAIALEAGEVFILDKDVAVQDVEIVAAAGAFEILAM